MAYFFGDGFDCYTSPADGILGYWDGGTAVSTLIAGRFAGSQAIRQSSNTGAPNWVKNSGVNGDAVHHIVIAYRTSVAIGGSTLGLYLQLSDGATNQVCIVFRTDGAILLTSATPNGTVLDTYTGAFTAPNTWFAFEFEVVIHPTTGSWAARKNGNPSNDRALGGLNTRPGTNSYANRLTIACHLSVNATDYDDVLWRSDASSVPWMGDIRCYSRLPAVDVGTPSFTRVPTSMTVGGWTPNTSSADTTTTVRYSQFTATYTGTVGTLIVNVNTGFTGNMKCALFTDVGGTGPGAVLGTSAVITNPLAGNSSFTFGTPVAVVRGTTYWFGVSHDVTVTLGIATGNTASRSGTGVTYASFPTANPTVGGLTQGTAWSAPITLGLNSEMLNEAQQDGTSTYVYDSTVGDQEFYTVAALPATPASTIAVIARGFMSKSDAGSRFGTLQLKSGGTTVAATTANLSTTFNWVWRTDLTDPNTGAAWSAASVNALQIGPKVVS